tara:strand:- start:155 stop:1054 length:900 start_codon:yes stop_codon:yes gene_type:complete
MKYHVSIHISPYEIDNYQTFIHQLRRNLNYVEDDIIFTPYLNLSNYFYNWDNSVLSSQFFINKFNTLNKIVEDYCEVDSIVNYEEKILGAFSYKTLFLNKYKDEVDAFIWFDSDMIFPDNTLSTLIFAHQNVHTKHCIITPQIVRLWDDTWDILVNEKYMDTPPSHENYFGFDGYKLFEPNDKDLVIRENNSNFKFASGWCNLISANLFRDYIDFTYDLGHYGPDDTFIMYLLDYYKFQKNNDIKQYVINNIIVTENYLHNLDPYKDLITKNKNIKSKEEFTNDVTVAIRNKLSKITNE